MGHASIGTVYNSSSGRHTLSWRQRQISAMTGLRRQLPRLLRRCAIELHSSMDLTDQTGFQGERLAERIKVNLFGW